MTWSVKLFGAAFHEHGATELAGHISHLIRLQKVPEASRYGRFATAITERSPQQDEYSGVCLTWHYIVISRGGLALLAVIGAEPQGGKHQGHL